MKQLLYIFLLISFSLHVYAQEPVKRAIVVGASVGMGRELCKILAANGYIVGMTARRTALLQELQNEIPTQTYSRYMDASQPNEAVQELNELIKDMGGLDLLVLAQTGYW